MSLTNVGDYEILFHWSRLEWTFADEALKKSFYENRSWSGAMPAGFKVDRAGRYYLSVPRWSPGIFTRRRRKRRPPPNSRPA